MFKTEAHVHTSDVSKCGQISAKEVIRLYAEAGFDTVFITEHINSASINSWGELGSWEEKVERYMRGYLAAREEGERLGIRVLFGAEICFKQPEGNCNDYLVYGIDRDFLLGYPDLNHYSIEEFYKYAKERGATVIQAHPHRGHKCYPTPEWVDGVEIFNAHPRHTNYNDEALATARRHGLIMTVGSDVHMKGDEARAYILTEERIESAEDYIRAITEGRAKFVTPEE